MAYHGRHSLLVSKDHRPAVPGELGAGSRAAIIFVGFNLTFFPQFILGYLGMPRRYATYAPEFQVLQRDVDRGRFDPWHRLSDPDHLSRPGLGAKGPISPQNPWHAKGLEWEQVAHASAHLQFRCSAGVYRARIQLCRGGDGGGLEPTSKRIPRRMRRS